jgi:hypothetical protein
VTVLQGVGDVAANHTGLSRRVLEYCLTTKRLVDEAKQPGFSGDRLDELGAFVAADDFERVGPFEDRMTWTEYAAFLAAWMPTADWDCSFRRITETGNLVFLELEERLGGDAASAVNSASIYEFDDAGRLRHLDVYLQMSPPAGART